MADYTLTHTGAELDGAIERVLDGYIDTSSATAAAADVMSGKTAFARGELITGTHTCGTPVLQEKSVAPDETVQTVTPDAGYGGLSSVTVGAIDPGYVGSGVARRGADDMAVSGATVTAPCGYYATEASKTVGSGDEGVPTAMKGAVTGHSVAVTPSVTNSAGYITGGTHSGSPVTVTAAELVSGTKEITENGTHDVTAYAAVSVSVQGGGGLPEVIKAGDQPVLISSVQAYTVAGTTMTDTGIEITVPRAGTYRFKCSAGRTSTSGTFTVQLYKNGAAISGATAAWSSRQATLSRDVTCAAGDTVSVYARSGATSNYTIVGQLAACIDWDVWEV